MPSHPTIPRPGRDEHDPSYAAYIHAVAGDSLWPVLTSQVDEAEAWLGGLPEERALHRYAPGKWSVKEVLGHVCDNERVFAYRALRFARGDATLLANFDENLYVRTAHFDRRPMTDILGELRTVRAATLALLRTLDAEALDRVGVARGLRMSARALAWIIAGHMAHHLDVLRARYGLR